MNGTVIAKTNKAKVVKSNVVVKKGLSDAEKLKRKNAQITSLMLKNDITGEKNAINQYTRHIDKMPRGKAYNLLVHIRKEEMTHLKELTKMLESL